MIDCSRFRGLLRSFGAVLVAMMGLNILLLVGLGSRPAWLYASKQYSLGYFEHLGGRIAGVLKNRREERRKGRVQKPLAVILGQSSVRAGVDETVMEAHDGRACRWLQLAGLGGHMQQFLFYTHLLLKSRLHPKLTVVGLHLSWAGTKIPEMRPAGGVMENDAWKAFSQGNWKSVLHISKRWLWIIDNRKRISKTFRLCLLWAQGWISDWFEWDPVVRFAPVSNPWHGDEPPAWKSEHASKEKIKRLLWKFDKFGWFEARHYDPHGDASRLLLGLLRKLRRFARGAKGHGKLVIVLMPERALMLARVPPQAKRCMKAILAEAFAGEPPPVLNLRNLMPDAYFFDLVHLNKRGRLEFSKRLAAKLGLYLVPDTRKEKRYP